MWLLEIKENWLFIQLAFKKLLTSKYALLNTCLIQAFITSFLVLSLPITIRLLPAMTLEKATILTLYYWFYLFFLKRELT